MIEIVRSFNRIPVTFGFISPPEFITNPCVDRITQESAVL